MNEPQVWTLIGVFAASMVGVITLVLRMMNTQFAAVTRQFDSMNRQFDSMRQELRSEIASLRNENSARFETLGAQISHLDRDVQAISKRVFPE